MFLCRLCFACPRRARLDPCGSHLFFEAGLPRSDPRGVMLFGYTYGFVPEERCNALEADTPLQQTGGEGVPKLMAVRAGNAGALEHFLEGFAPRWWCRSCASKRMASLRKSIYFAVQDLQNVEGLAVQPSAHLLRESRRGRQRDAAILPGLL